MILIASLLVALMGTYVYRDDHPRLYAFVVENEPLPPGSSFAEALLLWGGVYATVHFILYVPPQRWLFHKYKLVEAW